MSSDRKLITLRDRFPHLSRMTLWRLAREPDFPIAIVVRRRRYYAADELTEWEESHRRRRQLPPDTRTPLSSRGA